MNILKTFEANTNGRDFVIGDLHGCFSIFQNLLRHLKFDPSKDRMFSVGDLVDRGPQNLDCLELLYEPWFHAALSNHEQMMLEAFHGGRAGEFWIRNGGFWGIEALNDWRNQTRRTPTEFSLKVFDLLEKIADLPFLITVKLQNGKKVHIIHAELPPAIETGKTVTDEVLSSPEEILNLATIQTVDGDFITWGRYLFNRFYAADLSNIGKVKRSVAYDKRTKIFNDELSHIISGHTIVQRPLTIVGQTNIDTGAYGSLHPDATGWEALTCLELNTWKFYQATATDFREVEPVVVTKEDVQQHPPAAQS